MKGIGFFKIKEKSRGSPKIEKKSKFIATAIPVNTIDEVGEAINSISVEMKKATHNAYAYRIIDENGISEDWSDDGEVKGCAGLPILNILQGNNIYNTLMIVTRFYGRIHLGPAGLIRQYSKTAQDLIERVGLKELHE